MKHENGEGETERHDIHTANTLSHACSCLYVTQGKSAKKMCVRHRMCAQLLCSQAHAPRGVVLSDESVPTLNVEGLRERYYRSMAEKNKELPGIAEKVLKSTKLEVDEKGLRLLIKTR